MKNYTQKMDREKIIIPDLTTSEISEFFSKAAELPRRRYPKILHNPGAELNRVFNFLLEDTYMQPHLHPGDEKIEKMYLVSGKFSVIFFEDDGTVKDIAYLEKDKNEYCEIPAFTWHTYVMLSNEVISYETMMGKYEPETWKKLANWAPSENSPESVTYLESLKQMTSKLKS